MLSYAAQRPPEDKEKHYTPLALARHLVGLVPMGEADRVIDPSAGSARPFLRSFPTENIIHCELDEGSDFLSEAFDYDWAVTNPPYHLLWAFIDKASREARKGIGFLVNINGINSLTPKRLGLLTQRGLHLRRLHVCQVRRWFGRYYFIVFTKEPGPCAISWNPAAW